MRRVLLLFPFLMSEKQALEAALRRETHSAGPSLPFIPEIYQTPGLSARVQITSVPAPLPGRRQKRIKKRLRRRS